MSNSPSLWQPSARWCEHSAERLSALCLFAWILLPAVAPGYLQAAGRSEMRGRALEVGTRAPITGAVATLYSQAEDGTHYLTSSDPQGRFLFHGLSRGTYDLEVTLPGYRTGRKTQLNVRPPFRSIVEVLLEPGVDPDAGVAVERAAAAVSTGEEESGAILRLTLTGPDNAPVPEGLASLVPLTFEGGRHYAHSDTDGRVRFADQRPGRYRLVASAPGFLTVRSERIELAPRGSTHVIVILTPYPLDFAGNLEDMLPPEEPLLPRRLEIDLPEAEASQPGRTP